MNSICTLLLVLSFLSIGFVGCTTTCVPGRVVACECGTRSGVQSCTADGAFSSCSCESGSINNDDERRMESDSGPREDEGQPDDATVSTTTNNSQTHPLFGDWVMTALTAYRPDGEITESNFPTLTLTVGEGNWSLTRADPACELAGSATFDSRDGWEDGTGVVDFDIEPTDPDSNTCGTFWDFTRLATWDTRAEGTLIVEYGCREPLSLGCAAIDSNVYRYRAEYVRVSQDASRSEDDPATAATDFVYGVWTGVSWDMGGLPTDISNWELTLVDVQGGLWQADITDSGCQAFGTMTVLLDRSGCSNCGSLDWNGPARPMDVAGDCGPLPVPFREINHSTNFTWDIETSGNSEELSLYESDTGHTFTFVLKEYALK
jgi:hypothetical protein